MSTFTTRLLATKPASSEDIAVSILNSNFDLFDTAAGATIGLSASRPASAFSGRLWYSTDSTKLFVNTAASASAAASWADPVANALLSNIVLGGSVSASAGSVDITRSAGGTTAFTARVAADTQPRWQALAGGSMGWGSGTATPDVNLYRSAADTLKTDDSLVVGGGITAVGNMSASTTLTVGGAASLNGGMTVVGKGSRLYVKKSATQSKASDTTLGNDNHITFSLSASAVYQLTAWLAVSGPAAGDVKTAWAFTGAASGVVGNRYTLGPTTGVADVTAATDMRSSRHNWTTSTAYGTDGTATTHIEEGGLLDTAAGSGTITLQWAQNSSNATSTVMSSLTWAILERLA